MVRIVLDPEAPDRNAIQQAAVAIRAGGVIAIPTDTLYGLAVNAFDATAVQRVFDVKGREERRALPLVAATVGQVERCLGPLPPLGQRLAARFWPGPLTLVVAAPDTLGPAVTAGTGTIAVRVPAHRIAQELCAASETLLTATSANLSGQPPSGDPDAVAAALSGRLDVLIDAGRTPGGLPSTIVDVTGSEVRIIRAGAIAWDAIERCVREAP